MKITYSMPRARFLGDVQPAPKASEYEMRWIFFCPFCKAEVKTIYEYVFAAPRLTALCGCRACERVTHD